MPVVSIDVAWLNELIGKPIATEALGEALEQIGCDVEEVVDIGRHRCPRCNALVEAGVGADAVTSCSVCSYTQETPLPFVDKISVVRLDAGDVEDIQEAAQGVDAVINLTVLRFNPNIMQAALNSGAHYVDTATDEPIWSQLLKGEPLYLDQEFKDTGLTALIGCGATPGITNVLARYACDKLDAMFEEWRRGGYAQAADQAQATLAEIHQSLSK